MQTTQQHPLHLNVGFLLHQGAGTSREVEFDFPALQVGDDLELGFLRGALRFTRISGGLYLEGELASQIEMECDRCLTAVEQHVAVSFGDLLTHPPRPDSDPVLSIPETGIFNLGPLLREQFLLAVPSHIFCRTDCKGLCPHCGVNWNEETCDHPELDIDPRLAALKSLLPES